VRNSTLTDVAKVDSYIRELFSGLDIELSMKASSLPFVTDKGSRIVTHLARAVQSATGMTPALNTRGGTSDARYFARHGVPVAEFGVINDRIHGVNERVSIDEVTTLAQIFEDLIANFNKQ